MIRFLMWSTQIRPNEASSCPVRIPIVSEERIRSDRPDYIVVLPWDIRDEVMSGLAYVREWGAHFVTAIPELCVF